MLIRKLLFGYLAFGVISAIGDGVGAATMFPPHHMLNSEKKLKNVDAFDWLRCLINPQITENFSNDAGWKNLPWGAAIAEVKRELPGIKDIPPNSNIPAKNSEGNVLFTKPGMRLYLSDYDLDGAPATAIFSFDSYDKLEAVTVLSDTWRTQDYADRIWLDLATKYGNPIKDDKEDKANMVTRKAQWINKNTVIIFSTMEMGHDGEVDVSVVYRRGPLGALNKI
jgi:hypothetical protein